ncbi:carnitine palmitoyltransferase 2 [Arctopsyche grandis]|uniref:carnitine palmitoyltransferase 2 n=1 Tax=Arctopsyche grandis TaxID=121162 RepID=UPI00406D9D88
MSLTKSARCTTPVYNAFVISSNNYSTRRHVKNPEYQYMQDSDVPTLHFQKSLPRLPIPELKKSCARYLNAQRPLLDDNSYKHVEAQVSSFANGAGLELDKNLRKIDKQNKHTSYISKMWFDMYLKDRIPLPINYNPLIVFNNDPKPEFNNQVIRAANMLISSVRFMLSLRDGILAPEVFHLDPKKSDTNTFRKVTKFLPPSLSWYGAYAFKAYPLDMSQYMGLFGSSRIPETGKDRLVNDYKSKHILVQRRGYFYSFDVLDSEGNIIEPSQILSRLNYIMSDTRPPNEHPVGILTTQDRDVWASQRHHLLQIGNEKVLKHIDTALFNLVLDDETMDGDDKKVIRNFLHGDGKNRWFDKTFSLIVAGDGVAGVNFEHSWGDGVAVLRYFNDIYKETTTKPFVTPDSVGNEQDVDTIVNKLDLNLDDKLKENIERATKAYQQWYSSMAVNYLIYEGIGRNKCKSYKVSPDSLMQLGFQAAYHLMSGKYVGTYESCSTAAFKHGRTETIRPCTMQTKEFCDALHSMNRPSDAELANMIVKCSATHSELVKEAAMGQGFDRHLFALKHMAEENNMQLGIFTDKEYKMLNTSILSTSTLSSPAVMAGGFGPVVTDGLGIGYSVMDNAMGTVVTSYTPHNDGAEFLKALYKSFDNIKTILENASIYKA